MEGNTARDYSGELNAARNKDSQMPNAQLSHPGDLRVPQYGHSDNYNGAPRGGRADNYSQGFDSSFIDKANLRNVIKNKASEAENFLPHELKEKLEEARQKMHDAKQLGGQAKTLVKSMTPWGFFSLIGKIHPLTDIPYFFAVLAALLKDGLDLVIVGSFPVIGTVITSCNSLFIMAMMFLGNIAHAEHDRTVFQSVLLKQFGVLIFTLIIELVFGLNLAPFQSVGVIFIYAFALAARKGRDNAVEE